MQTKEITLTIPDFVIKTGYIKTKVNLHVNAVCEVIAYVPVGYGGNMKEYEITQVDCWCDPLDHVYFEKMPSESKKIITTAIEEEIYG